MWLKLEENMNAHNVVNVQPTKDNSSIFTYDYVSIPDNYAQELIDIK